MGICCNKSKRENGCVAVNMKGDQILSHFNAEWKFKKADLMNLKVSEYLDGKYYYDINIPGLQYNIDVYLPPNHYHDTWIFLKVNGSNERNINVECTVHVPSANVSKKLRGVYIQSRPSFFERSSLHFTSLHFT